MAIVIGKHILSGRPVEMTRQPNGKLLFKVVARPSDPPFTDGIAFEIEPLKLWSALGPPDEYLPPYSAADAKASFYMERCRPVTNRQACGCALGRCFCAEEAP